MIAATVLATAIVLVAYILIGYPLLLAFAPGRSAPEIKKDLTFTPTVSVILAVHNGAAFLASKLASIQALDYPRERVTVMVISDGSTDATDSIAQKVPGVCLLRQPHQGKAVALNLALTQAQGEILFFTDVRQPLDPLALRHLAANFADQSVGAVTGEMRLYRPEAGEQADMDLYWRYELWARTRQSRRDSIFNTTGCIYALRRSLARPLREETLSDDAMLPLEAFFRGYRVIFDPEAVAWDQPAVGGTEFRRRWRNLAGLWQVHLWRTELFTSRNRMRWHFLSHKFARLILPWALLTAVAATWALPESPSRWFFLSDEAAFLFAAVLDRAIPRRWFIKRITSPARTFLLMNLAALAAVAVFFVPPQKLWKQTRVANSPAAERR